MNQKEQPAQVKIARKLVLALAGQRFTFDDRKTLFHHATQTLLVADLHLGKSQSFMSAGIAVPDSSESDLRALLVIAREYQSKRVIILGDLFHAKSGMTPEIYESLEGFIHALKVPVELVMGNHDHAALKADEDGVVKLNQLMGVCEEMRLDDQKTLLRHFPVMPAHDDDRFKASQASELVICGHMHPACHLSARGELATRFSTFVYEKPNLILPAFGRFTGCKTMYISKSHPESWLVPITPGGLFQLPGNQKKRSD